MFKSGHITIHHFFLLITAIIWGSTFVIQKNAMESIDPYLYSSLRFFVGSFFLIPVILVIQRRNFFPKFAQKAVKTDTFFDWGYCKRGIFEKKILQSGLIAGMILALGINLQQIALYYTQVTKVGFITSFYIILVPFIGVFLGRKLSWSVFLPAVIAITGFYFISYKGSLAGFDGLGGFARGDVITLVSSLFWAIHIVYLDSCSKKLDILMFSFLQFFFCGLLTLIFVLAVGIDIRWDSIQNAGMEIIYGGVISVGIGFTLQVFGQKGVDPHIAALIVSLEAVFAAIFEMLILRTFLTPIEIFGCFLLFATVIYSEFLNKNHNLAVEK